MYELPLLIELIEFEKKKEVGTILNGRVREYFFISPLVLDENESRLHGFITLCNI